MHTHIQRHWKINKQVNKQERKEREKERNASVESVTLLCFSSY